MNKFFAVVGISTLIAVSIVKCKLVLENKQNSGMEAHNRVHLD